MRVGRVEMENPPKTQKQAERSLGKQGGFSNGRNILRGSGHPQESGQLLCQAGRWRSGEGGSGGSPSSGSSQMGEALEGRWIGGMEATLFPLLVVGRGCAYRLLHGRPRRRLRWLTGAPITPEIPPEREHPRKSATVDDFVVGQSLTDHQISTQIHTSQPKPLKTKGL